MALALTTAMLNLGAATIRLLKTEQSQDRRGRDGRGRLVSRPLPMLCRNRPCSVMTLQRL